MTALKNREKPKPIRCCRKRPFNVKKMGIVTLKTRTLHLHATQ